MARSRKARAKERARHARLRSRQAFRQMSSGEFRYPAGVLKQRWPELDALLVERAPKSRSEMETIMREWHKAREGTK